MPILVISFCIILLVILISRFKVNPFLAFLIMSLLAGILSGMDITAITTSVRNGIGKLLGSLLIVIVSGSMMGKLVAESGAAQQITTSLLRIFSVRYIHWALMLTGFIVGIPLFYNVGFVLIVPLVFAVAYQNKLPVVFLGISMLAGLSVTHGFLPPHPAPTALVGQFHADIGKTLLYGIVIALSNSLFTALLPVILLAATSVTQPLLPEGSNLKKIFLLVGDSDVVMLISLTVATFTLGVARKTSIAKIMNTYQDAVKDIAMILLIVAGSGALKEILVDSGASKQIGESFQNLNMNPLFLGWLIAAVIRISIGSATVAGLTAGGIIAPTLTTSHADPNLMVLAVGAGSLMFSHVNDSGFWLYKEYFNLGMRQTFLSWSLMETIVSVCGLIGVFILQTFL